MDGIALADDLSKFGFERAGDDVARRDPPDEVRECEVALSPFAARGQEAGAAAYVLEYAPTTHLGSRTTSSTAETSLIATAMRECRAGLGSAPLRVRGGQCAVEVPSMI
jgi:hypothetical protein